MKMLKDTAITNNILKKGGYRVGLFFGTFDPPHQGHLFVAETALHYLALDYIVFIPAKHNPFKQNPQSDYNFRFVQTAAMISHPLSGQGKIPDPLLISDIELFVDSYYSYDVLIYFLEKFQSNDYFFLMGADLLMEFDKWHRYNDLVNLIDIAVIDRNEIHDQLENTKFYQQYRDNQILPGEMALKSGGEKKWCYLAYGKCDISSTKLRND